MTAPHPKALLPPVVELCNEYLAMPGNGSGGSLHIVLDDGNLQDHHIQYCRDFASDRGDWRGAVLADKILALTRSQRHRLLRKITPPAWPQETAGPIQLEPPSRALTVAAAKALQEVEPCP